MTIDTQIKVQILAGTLAKLRYKKGDKLVVLCKERLDAEQTQPTAATIRQWLGHNAPILILDEGMQLGVVREERVDPRDEGYESPEFCCGDAEQGRQ